MWFSSWSDVAKVVLAGTAAYATLVLVLRVSGKRTLAKLNAFDFVVTVALGSTLATILLSRDVSAAEGAAAFATLAVLQLVVAMAVSHLPFARAAVTSGPTLLVREGILLEAAMSRQRVGASDIRQALRKSGSGDLSGVGAVVLETDGTFSVIAADDLGTGWALEDVPLARRSRRATTSLRGRGRTRP